MKLNDLSETKATLRLADRYGLDREIHQGSLDAAKAELRDLQPLTFDLEGEISESVLDWLCLRAHGLHEQVSGAPPAQSVKAGNVTVKLRDGEQVLSRLISPYLKATGHQERRVS